MAKDLLVEIGMEEIPARFVRDAGEQLKEKLIKWLSEANLSHEGANLFATPRRIAVVIEGLQEKQEDSVVEMKGPSRKIAEDGEGGWTKAAIGFAKSQKVDLEDLFYKEIKGIEYIHARKENKGLRTEEVLPQVLKEIILSMSFPKNMRWGSGELRFVRPIRWIVALFGSQVVPFEVENVTSGRITRGHRFLGSETTIEEASTYVANLQEQYVIVDPDVRRKLVLDGIERLANQHQWHVPIDEELLEEVVFLVEYPTVLYGSFAHEFLEIPQEVLITSMREHQRYFPVMDMQGQLLPYFITVRNGNEDGLDQVARGNEKVLRARLSDARFFYHEDQKLKINTALEKLEKVVFHEELGTIGDKVRRIRSNAEAISKNIGVDKEMMQNIDRAAEICKFDLVSQMVYEFPELQGVMGEDYARRAGENDCVARAIFEHYQPRSASDTVPASSVGAVVSISDKMDTIAGCFSIGIVPTGSQDPYALRRQAAGVIQILLEHKLSLTLDQLIVTALNIVKQSIGLKRKEEEIIKDMTDFFQLRVKHMLGEFARYDVVDAVIASGIFDVQAAVRKAQALQAVVEQPEQWKPLFESINRVHNLAVKAEQTTLQVDLLHENAEKALAEEWRKVQADFTELLKQRREAEALHVLHALRDPITNFFEEVMVMAEDPTIRNNRLALLASMSEQFNLYADFRKIVW